MNLGADLITTFQDFVDTFIQLLPKVGRGILLFILGILFIHFFMKLVVKFIDYIRISLGLKEILVILSRAVLWILLVIGVLQMLGLSNIAIALSGFVAALSIGISQGFTQTVTDLVSGIQLANDQDFRVGDRVIAGEKDHRIEGYIIEMDTKKTRIMDKHGNLHILPNALIDRNEWTLLERDEIVLAHLKRSDIIKVIHHKIKKKGARKE